MTLQAVWKQKRRTNSRNKALYQVFVPKLRSALCCQHKMCTNTFIIVDILNRLLDPLCGHKVFILFGQLGNQLQGILLRLG